MYVGARLEWAVPRGVNKAPARPFVVGEVPELVRQGFDLCVTGSTLQVFMYANRFIYANRALPEPQQRIDRALNAGGSDA
jgi:hypothetical protein